MTLLYACRNAKIKLSIYINKKFSFMIGKIFAYNKCLKEKR